MEDQCTQWASRSPSGPVQRPLLTREQETGAGGGVVATNTLRRAAARDVVDLNRVVAGEPGALALGRSDDHPQVVSEGEPARRSRLRGEKREMRSRPLQLTMAGFI